MSRGSIRDAHHECVSWPARLFADVGFIPDWAIGVGKGGIPGRFR
jgi:hypothetical protein